MLRYFFLFSTLLSFNLIADIFLSSPKIKVNDQNQRIIEFRIENFADVVNVNLMGTMRITHAMLPKLALSRGNIVNITSANFNLSIPNTPAYVATKGGLEALTKSMATCWAEHKVRVNSVAPTNAKDYIKKIECFCFAEGIELMPGEEILLPIKMVVDNELPSNIKNIVLSYTIFDSNLEKKIIMIRVCIILPKA